LLFRRCALPLLDADDVDAVKALLQCSTAYELTQAARDAVTAQRDAQIAALKDAGKSVREIARETGVPRSTVHRVGVPDFQPGKTGQPERGDRLPPEEERWAAIAEINDMLSPRGERWWAGYRALASAQYRQPVRLRRIY